MARWWLPAVLFLSVAAPALAQEPAAIRKIVLPGLDSQVAARLTALDRRLNPVHSPQRVASLLGQLFSPMNAFAPLLADPRNREVWEQMPDEYYRMMQESGDSLVALHESANLGVGWSSGQVRRLCHQRLAALPRSSLELYRRRVDAEALALLEQGRRSRSPVPLRRLVDELFCSTYGDQALDLLGDLAFERGDFAEARHWWRLLTPREDTLHFPHPKIDIVRVEAKQILATIFEGQLEKAAADITAFARKYPAAKGSLAGQTDAYAAILQKTLTAFVKDQFTNNDEPWTTFGGDPARDRSLTHELPVHLWEDGYAWQVALPSLTAESKVALPNRHTLVRRTAFHPIIINNQVLIADHRSVISYHLITGKELFRYDLKAAGLHDPGPGLHAKIRMPRFTLSADQDRAYVRLGQPRFMPKKSAEKEDSTYLVCLDLTHPEQDRKRELWHLEASADDKSLTMFEGSPLVRDGQVYIAQSKIVGRRVVTSIVCFDVQGRRRWSREVCDCPEFEDVNILSRDRQHLLTLASGQIVYCSNAGVIVAVDAWTGQPTWGMRYPSRGPLTSDFEPSPRDLAPPVYADGRIYVAPLDTDRLFCLDAFSGQTIWEVDSVEVVHLLGVSQGRLIAATRNGMLAIHTTTGDIEWTQPALGRLPSFGRGLIAGNHVYWPTQDPNQRYRVVSLREGQPEAPPILPAGNMAFGQGCLAIAGLDELTVYVPAHRRNLLPPAIGSPHAHIDALYQQARRQTSAGQKTAAAKSYQELLDITKHERAWRDLVDIRTHTSRERKRPEVTAPIKLDAKAPIGPAEPALPLVRAWSQKDGKIWPTDADEYRDDFFFCTDADQINCCNLSDGTLHWRIEKTFDPIWFGRWRDLVLVCNKDDVRALRVADGEFEWAFQAPSRKWRVASLTNGLPTVRSTADGFVHVQRSGNNLVLLDDHRQFFWLRLDTGETIWQYAPPGAAIRPLDDAAFSPFVAHVGDRLWMQSVTGQPYWFGVKPTQTGLPSRPWIQAPLVIGKRIVYAGDGGHVFGNDDKPPHDRRWTYKPAWPSSLTGAMSRLINKASVLLVLMPRNEGHECVRLDPETGKVLWSLAARRLGDDVDHSSFVIGDTSFFYVRAGVLHARSLNDGTLQWTQPLEKELGNWRLRYTKHYLAVYPATASGDSYVGFIDPWDGRWLQRLPFPGAKGPVDLLLAPRVAVVSIGGRNYGFRPLETE